jgi:hypothetical protein
MVSTKSLANLKPVKKGEVRNPKGVNRGKSLFRVAELMQLAELILLQKDTKVEKSIAMQQLGKSAYEHWRNTILERFPSSSASSVVTPPEWDKANGGTKDTFILAAEGAVANFLNELYAMTVDPRAEGEIKIAEIQRRLRILGSSNRKGETK